ncbi:hypothetical protein MFRU_028g00980 [Monilinia fructicola]|nr:hypothetical protein MFRU_028g00980 [Monilinia fructicola]
MAPQPPSLTLLRTLARPLTRPLHPTTPCRPLRSASTKASTPHHANYWSTDVYWGKAVRNIGNGLVLYVPVVACVMFWPTPIAPFFNLVKGVKNMESE